MSEFISNLIGDNYIATAVMSLVPLIELKGGIIFARQFMGAGLAFLLAYLGSTIAFIPVYWLLIPILNGLKKIKWFNGFATKIENYFKIKADDALKKQEGKKGAKMSEKLLKQLAVFLFVAIPLPMTGVWTGTAVAVFLGLRFKDSILPIILGNVVAGGLILGLAELWVVAFGSAATLDYVLWGLLALALVLLVVTIVKICKTEPITEPLEEKGQHTKDQD
jgi:uncharacterized membrane protein